MKKVLIVVHSKLFFPRMLELGHLVLGSGQFEPVFHFAYKTGWENIEQDMAVLEAQEFGVSENTRLAVLKRIEDVKIEQAFPVSKSIVNGIKILLRILPKNVYNWLSTTKKNLLYNNFFVSMEAQRQRLLEIRGLLREEKADIVVLTMDVPTWDTGIFIRAARLENIPSMVSITQTGPLDEALYVYSKKGVLSTQWPWNFVLGKIYPQWVGQRNNKRFLMTSFGVTLAKELLGVSMPQPWIDGSSHADAILLENEAYLERGKSIGLKASNLFLTGQPYHDFLYSVKLKKEESLLRFYDLHGLQPGKPILLTSLLPKYADRDNSGMEFASYEEIVEFWMRSLASFGQYHTVLSLHPTLKYSDYAYIEKWGVKITQMPIPEIMPLCHVFVASLTSAITMAIACGLPVINYDFARYGNAQFDNVPGVLKVERKKDFKAALEKLLNDPSYYQEIARLQQEQASRWGVLDGQAGKRILQVMSDLLKKGNNNA